MITPKSLLQYVKAVRNIMEENLWASIWHDTMSGMEWAKNMPGISPGRSAVGYNYLYVMTRILNELKPTTVLDIGLGVSSTLISHYFRHIDSKEKCGAIYPLHLILEHDQSWVDFYVKNHEISQYTKIALQKLTLKQFKNNEYYAYKDISNDIKNRKFSVVSIDAPFGFNKNKRGGGGVNDILGEILSNLYQMYWEKVLLLL